MGIFKKLNQTIRRFKKELYFQFSSIAKFAPHLIIPILLMILHHLNSTVLNNIFFFHFSYQLLF